MSPDTWLTLEQAAAYIATRPGGKPVVKQTVWDWTAHGVRGIVLESQHRGMYVMTKVEWIEEFFARVAVVKGLRLRRAHPEHMTPKRLTRSQQEARDQLEQMNARYRRPACREGHTG